MQKTGQEEKKNSPGEMLDSRSRWCCLLIKDVLWFQLPS